MHREAYKTARNSRGHKTPTHKTLVKKYKNVTELTGSGNPITIQKRSQRKKGYRPRWRCVRTTHKRRISAQCGGTKNGVKPKEAFRQAAKKTSKNVHSMNTAKMAPHPYTTSNLLTNPNYKITLKSYSKSIK